jgi:hypothetical protein
MPDFLAKTTHPFVSNSPSLRGIEGLQSMGNVVSLLVSQYLQSVRVRTFEVLILQIPQVRKLWRILTGVSASCETTGGREISNVKNPMSKEIRNSDGLSFARLCTFAPLRRKQHSAAQQRMMKQPEIRDFFRSTLKPSKTPGFRSNL